jgi:hypothetical protein
MKERSRCFKYADRETSDRAGASYINCTCEISGGTQMNAVEVQTHAHKLYEAHGAKALAEAAQMVHQYEQRGDKGSADDWRRIENALQQLRGPHVS